MTQIESNWTNFPPLYYASKCIKKWRKWCLTQDSKKSLSIAKTSEQKTRALWGWKILTRIGKSNSTLKICSVPFPGNKRSRGVKYFLRLNLRGFRNDFIYNTRNKTTKRSIANERRERWGSNFLGRKTPGVSFMQMRARLSRKSASCFHKFPIRTSPGAITHTRLG